MARSSFTSRRFNSLLLAVCFGLSASAALAQDVVKFGAPLPLTGPLAPEAVKQQQGYDLWAEQANKAGGISVGGREVQGCESTSTPITSRTRHARCRPPSR